MFCVKLTRAMKVRSAGEVIRLPKGRCLEVASVPDQDFYFLVIDETGEHIRLRRNDSRIVEATVADMARER